MLSVTINQFEDNEGCNIMIKTYLSIVLTGLVLTVILAACNMPSGLLSGVDIETPSPAPSPSETPTLETIPTETSLPAYATPELAPICPVTGDNLPSNPQCEITIAEQSSVFCNQKVPYNLILINAGATFQTLTEGFECTDAGMKDDKQMVTCTGPMASQFNVQICDPACALPTVQAELTQCPDGYMFADLLGCCTQEFQPSNSGCQVFTFETTSCIVDCGQYKKKTKCEDHYYACQWISETKTCQLRR
jgi:hypothetical protein